MDSTLLLLADGRFPTGGHVHSGGVEAAVTDGRIGDPGSLARYLRGRLATTGRLDAEAMARCPSPALRAAGRSQGRGILRAGRRTWPDERLDELDRKFAGSPWWALALGAVVAAAGATPTDAALLAAQSSVATPAWAGVRLLGLDPFEVTGVLADLSAPIDQVAADTGILMEGGATPDRFPASSGPLTDIAAEAHAHGEVRLFAS
jgi:urease accessory protein